MERVTGLEPVVSTLGKLHVTTTPNPQISVTGKSITDRVQKVKRFMGIEFFGTARGFYDMIKALDISHATSFIQTKHLARMARISGGRHGHLLANLNTL
jgi:hypothetical protein